MVELNFINTRIIRKINDKIHIVPVKLIGMHNPARFGCKDFCPDQPGIQQYGLVDFFALLVASNNDDMP